MVGWVFEGCDSWIFGLLAVVGGEVVGFFSWVLGLKFLQCNNGDIQLG